MTEVDVAHNEFWAAIFEMCTVSILVNAFFVRVGRGEAGVGAYVHPDFSPALTAHPPRFLALLITRPSISYLGYVRILISVSVHLSKNSLGERKSRDLTKSDNRRFESRNEL